jgi:hypothetical protein
MTCAVLQVVRGRNGFSDCTLMTFHVGFPAGPYGAQERAPFRTSSKTFVCGPEHTLPSPLTPGLADVRETAHPLLLTRWHSAPICSQFS